MRIKILILLAMSALSGRAQIHCSFIEKKQGFGDVYLGRDGLQNEYHRTANTLFKETSEKTYAYANPNFGNIHSVDIENPLKLVVFYRDFNTVVVLDNRLNELETLVFDQNLSFVKKSSANRLWRFNTDAQKIENYDYKKHRVVSSTPPLSHRLVKDMKSDLNSVFLLTDRGIFTYDYLGNLHETYLREGIEQFSIGNGLLYVQTSDGLFQIKEKTEALILPTSLSLKKYFVFRKELFIFDGNHCHRFKMGKND